MDAAHVEAVVLIDVVHDGPVFIFTYYCTSKSRSHLKYVPDEDLVIIAGSPVAGVDGITVNLE